MKSDELSDETGEPRRRREGHAVYILPKLVLFSSVWPLQDPAHSDRARSATM
jgi:hypothetical protein